MIIGSGGAQLNRARLTIKIDNIFFMI